MNHIVTSNSEIAPGITCDFDFILLDGSGSMASKWWPMLEAIDKYIFELKAQAIDTHITMHIFDSSNIQLEARNLNIRNWKSFIDEPVGAHFSGTPLYDAIVMMGRTIRDLNPDPSRGRRILVVTDGEDTGNKFADITTARSILDWLRAQGFQITFMGCDFNNRRQAAALGANVQNTIGVRSEKLTEATQLLGKRAARHSRTGEDINFSEEERRDFGGYLSGPSGG